MPTNLENSAMVTGLEKVSFHFNPKESNIKECSNYSAIMLISHNSKVMLKNLQARLQQWTFSVNRELSDVQVGFRKSRRTRDQIDNIWWIIKKAREFQKNFYFCLIDYAKASDYVDHNKLWKILKEMGIRDHLTCPLQNLYASQEATVRTRHGTMDWLIIGERIRQGCILSPCLFNLYAEFSSVQSLSHVWLSATPWSAAHQASVCTTNSLDLLKLMSFESVMPSIYLILCCPLLFLPSIFPRTRVFSNESVNCIKWPQYWSSSFSISPSNEYSGLISFRMDWFVLLAVQGSLKSLL